jgi:hypothetical protein
MKHAGGWTWSANRVSNRGRVALLIPTRGLHYNLICSPQYRGTDICPTMARSAKQKRANK